MKHSVLIVALLLAFAFGGIASAQQQQQGAVSDQQQQSASEIRPGVLANAEDLKGKNVVDPNGKRLGKVDNVVLDLANGKISYVAVDPGRGGKLVPVPFDAFGVTRNRQLVLNVDRNKLNSAPSFAKRGQANWMNEEWARQVSNYWGKTPSGTTAARTPSALQPTTMGGSSQPPEATQQQMGQQPTQNQGQRPMSTGPEAPSDQSSSQ